ncbi:MAG TPA: ABC transporter substrate-binding protein [Methylomirabilota bacterium]|jgi:phospholipid transport system substrate-binding protein
MGYRRTRLLAGLILALLAPAVGAGAGEPTEQLRADIDELYRLAAPVGQPGAPARAIVDRMFDWTTIAEASLRDHWRKRTAAERAEFTRLFADLFARAYTSRIHLVDAKSFRYVGDATAGDHSTVKTKVLTKRGSTIDVDYVMRATPGQRWHVQDVRVETISLVDNYRVQFDTIISKASYDELVKRLRAAVK